MKKLLVIAALIGCILPSGSMFAQINLNFVSANLGAIREFDPSLSGKTATYFAYPEMQIGGDFLAPWWRWTAYWGYWNEGDEKQYVTDTDIYSYSGHIVGLRWSFLPAQALPHWPLPIGIFAGLGEHFVSAKHLDGSDYYGRQGSDFHRNVTLMELGVNIEIPVSGLLAVRGEFQHYIQVGHQEFSRERTDRSAYKLGVAVRI